jgi:hypothetical protein
MHPKSGVSMGMGVDDVFGFLLFLFGVSGRKRYKFEFNIKFAEARVFSGFLGFFLLCF